jgi:hypothetical protein
MIALADIDRAPDLIARCIAGIPADADFVP